MNSTCELGGDAARALKPYPAYKDSGVEWLGDVPVHWGVLRLKQICRLAYGDALADAVRRDGAVPVLGSNGRVGFHDSANTKAPCIVIGRKGSFGKVNYSPDPAFAIDTTFFVDSRFSSANIRWLFFLLRWLRLDEVTRDSAVPGLDREDTYQRPGVLPPLPEQAAIVRFLDHADWRIRRYIRAQQKLIALLEEQKQAIIHQAVTGQIDVRTGQPYLSYKSSGVEWFPEVPDHWNVLPMRRVIYSAVDGPHFSPTYLDTGIPFLSARNVKAHAWSLEDAKCISEDDYDEFNRRVKPVRGDVLYTKGGTTGVARVVDLTFPFQVWVHIAVLKVNKNAIDPEFLAAALNSTRCYEQSQLFTRGATNQDLGLGRMKGIELPVPPALAEQQAIVGCLRTGLGQVLEASSATHREIALLGEYRTRLIADVVTGKLDVREAAAGLPDEVEEPEPLDEADALIDGEEEPTDALATAH